MVAVIFSKLLGQNFFLQLWTFAKEQFLQSSCTTLNVRNTIKGFLSGGTAVEALALLLTSRLIKSQFDNFT